MTSPLFWKSCGAGESGPLACQNHPLELFAARRVLVLTRGLLFRTQLGARNGLQRAARPSGELSRDAAVDQDW